MDTLQSENAAGNAGTKARAVVAPVPSLSSNPFGAATAVPADDEREYMPPHEREEECTTLPVQWEMGHDMSGTRLASGARRSLIGAVTGSVPLPAVPDSGVEMVLPLVATFNVLSRSAGKEGTVDRKGSLAGSEEGGEEQDAAVMDAVLASLPGSDLDMGM